MSALTVYQFCNPCNRERAHKFTSMYEIACTKCSKVTKISASREKPTETQADLSFKEEMTKGSNLPKPKPQPVTRRKTSTIVQPVALLNLLKGVRV